MRMQLNCLGRQVLCQEKLVQWYSYFSVLLLSGYYLWISSFCVIPTKVVIVTIIGSTDHQNMVTDTTFDMTAWFGANLLQLSLRGVWWKRVNLIKQLWQHSLSSIWNVQYLRNVVTINIGRFTDLQNIGMDSDVLFWASRDTYISQDKCTKIRL